jgi:hypothetical protein
MNVLSEREGDKRKTDDPSTDNVVPYKLLSNFQKCQILQVM